MRLQCGDPRPLPRKRPRPRLIVLVHYVNKRRSEGASVEEAVHDAGMVRFRPIILTSVTTFGGLTPLLLERSVQAKFLIPMAVSFAYGVVFATFITLVIVTVAYVVLDDIKKLGRRTFGLGGSVAESGAKGSTAP